MIALLCGRLQILFHVNQRKKVSIKQKEKEIQFMKITLFTLHVECCRIQLMFKR